MAKDEMNGANGEAAAVTAPPMEMDATVRLIEPRNNLLGFANVTFNGVLTVTDFKVLRGEDGNLFVGMPSKPDPGSRTGYSTTVRIADKDAKQQLTGTVIEGYHAAVAKLKARAAAITEENPAPIKEQFDKAGKEADKHNAERPPQTKGKDKNAEL
jgi:DNA-binding cell septation regulator SpoVG